MSLQMQRKMVGSGESSLAVRALERLDSGVFPHVPCQLVRSSKLPAATFPRALVRFFTRVCSLVSLQVGALGVDFVAAGVGTAMDALVSLRLGRVVVDSVHQFVGIVGGKSGGHDVGESGVLLHGRGGIGTRWAEGEVVKGGGARVAVGSGCCRWVVVGSIGHMGVEVDGDRRGLGGGVRGRGESGKVGQLGLRGDHVRNLVIGRTRRCGGHSVRKVL